MLKELRSRQQHNNPIHVGLIGSGAMGRGIAYQVSRTPGMRLSFIADLDPTAAAQSLDVLPENAPTPTISSDPANAIETHADSLDVLVEASNAIGPAGDYCLAAMNHGAHVVLMNAEVDLALGPLLQLTARENKVICTSDAGDQHGVLMRMIEEIQLWGFRIVQAGNIKGFLDRYATADTLQEEAAKRRLNPIQCCAYTDGTKLGIEMALVANALDLTLTQRGMTGPRATKVSEALQLFDFDSYPPEGTVDYILGAEPGGGVYVIGHCDDPIQSPYLSYYKLGDGPYYLFYRPYHLCHLETPRAIALAALQNQAVLTPQLPPKIDVYAFAKKDLQPGDSFGHGIGGPAAYGLIETTAIGQKEHFLPITHLEPSPTTEATLKVARKKDEPILTTDVDLPEGSLKSLLARQNQL